MIRRPWFFKEMRGDSTVYPTNHKVQDMTTVFEYRPPSWGRPMAIFQSKALTFQGGSDENSPSLISSRKMAIPCNLQCTLCWNNNGFPKFHEIRGRNTHRCMELFICHSTRSRETWVKLIALMFRAFLCHSDALRHVGWRGWWLGRCDACQSFCLQNVGSCESPKSSRNCFKSLRCCGHNNSEQFRS